ncbi:hypothetical protein SDC9_205944 [bioreactor metagenome]|uniref:Uncharacterized protein n=1 Tax=bioreactor metagenome TaxID=1076179 RepID=A0A645J3N4_9ZZZZ
MQPFWLQFGQGPAIEPDFTGVRIVEAQHQAEDGGLAAAGRADDAEGFAAPEAEADVGEVVLHLVVGEADMAELDVGAAASGWRNVGYRVQAGNCHVCRSIEDLGDAVGAGGALRVEIEQA